MNLSTGRSLRSSVRLLTDQQFRQQVYPIATNPSIRGRLEEEAVEHRPDHCAYDACGRIGAERRQVFLVDLLLATGGLLSFQHLTGISSLVQRDSEKYTYARSHGIGKVINASHV